MRKTLNFGEEVEGYNIPVLNEREIRAAAGILFLFTFISFMVIIFNGDFTMFKIVISGFLLDFLIRVFINPKFSPTLILGRFTVRNQTPEYVGAAQKKFSWYIGVGLAAVMFVHMVVINAFSPITGIICLICLVFLFFESAFGICLGCKFYNLFFKEKAQHCPGEVCDMKSRQDIQKISGMQFAVLVGFAALIFITSYVIKDEFSKRPYDIFGIEEKVQNK
ncbi:MAG: DUF4395 domain-containing protein [Ignavibacteria bacterium]